jgi:DNA modification methylase
MIRVIQGDCRDVLATLPDESVHTVVTSPPYWSLRDYGCEGQIGLEETLPEHMTAMVEVFREVRRILRKDGTCWINYGDAYAGSWGAQSREHAGKHASIASILSANQIKAAQIRTKTGAAARTPGLKAKDRMLLPARLAIALCDDGWWVRDEIVWQKPNPMPAPARGRTTPAHEMIYMFARSEQYFYDGNAIAEPIAESSKARYAQATVDTQPGGFKQDAYESGITGARARSRRPNEIINLAKKHNNQSEKLVIGEKWQARHQDWEQIKDDLTTRIKRSVWTVPTLAFGEAHFATFPPALIEPCILAGCPKGGTVLDPFGGAGTTGLVADRLGRNAILIELNEAYAAMAERRIRSDAGMFAEISQ